jgi:excisionase family DNA binding protein
MNSGYMSVSKIAKKIGVHPKVIYAAISSGQLQAFRPGKRTLRISADAFANWEKQQTEGGK